MNLNRTAGSTRLTVHGASHGIPFSDLTASGALADCCQENGQLGTGLVGLAPSGRLPSAGMTFQTAADRQRGLSLVELMVAMVVSLLLLGGVVQMAISNKQTYTFQQTQALNQENSRYSYYYLDDILNKAGYRAAPQDGLEVVFEQVAADGQCGAFVNGQIVAASAVGSGVCIRYQRAVAGELDCTGTAIADANPFITRVYYNPSTETLMCGAQGTVATTLIDNVAGLQVEYGVETGSGNLSFVATPTDWADVVALRVSVLGVSETDVLNAHQSYAFPLHAASLTTASDLRAYRSSQKTIQIRNAVLN